MEISFLLKTFLTPLSVSYGLSFDAQPDIYWPFCSDGKRSYRTRVKQKCGNFEGNNPLKQGRWTYSVVISAVYAFWQYTTSAEFLKQNWFHVVYVRTVMNYACL